MWRVSFIVRNSLRNRLRSTLTILSFAASLCLMGLLAAMTNALFLREATPEQALRLIVRNKVSLANPLTRSYEDKIRQVPLPHDVVDMLRVAKPRGTSRLVFPGGMVGGFRSRSSCSPPLTNTNPP